MSRRPPRLRAFQPRWLALPALVLFVLTAAFLLSGN